MVRRRHEGVMQSVHRTAHADVLTELLPVGGDAVGQRRVPDPAGGRHPSRPAPGLGHEVVADQQGRQALARPEIVDLGDERRLVAHGVGMGGGREHRHAEGQDQAEHKLPHRDAAPLNSRWIHERAECPPFGSPAAIPPNRVRSVALRPRVSPGLPFRGFWLSDRGIGEGTSPLERALWSYRSLRAGHLRKSDGQLPGNRHR